LRFQSCGELAGVLAEQVQRHVVGPGDVGCLELGRGADVDHGDVVRVAQWSTVTASTVSGV